MQPYPQYKDSGVEWIGEIPEHWQMLRMDGFAKYEKNTVIPDCFVNEKVVHYSIPSIQAVNKGLLEEGKSIDSSKLLLSGGELLISKLNPRKNTIVIANIHNKHRIVASTEFIPLKARTKKQTVFLYYLFRSQGVISLLCSTVESATKSHQRTNPVNISKLWFACPKEQEQQQIANYLDHKTQQIDTLIEKKQLLIDLLKEERTAVINEAVTKGIDPDAPMKDSGIEWLGEVPEHWNIVALKHLASMPIIDGPHVSPKKHDEGIPFISAQAIGKGFIDFDKKWGYISPEDHELFSQRYKPERGDILLVKLGATTGVSAIVETDTEFSIWVPLAAIRLRKHIQPRFIFHVLGSDNLRVAYELSWTYGTQQTLGLGTISNLHVPLPPEKEQQYIMDYLDHETTRIDTIITNASKEINLLKEYRTALISEVVTGKIDVRDWEKPENDSNTH